ncbi:unnamed protein product [Bursaphelenchus xylophilus]|uniref:(pine wood nematode) hypothetical protein n=1 Tax=Bursaphelenchus xylophilus TaxID=6326 RepID=A0A1I7SDK4_BURXY|nr:unnamed protein product [Bursaphelenchus xylophilus]CAG9120814.1 unnamed protein product [Bursaphelenchus xylophilus]
MRLIVLTVAVFSIGFADVLKVPLGKVEVKDEAGKKDYYDKPFELYEKSFYTVDVKVGNPPQTLKLGLDIGSNQFWLLDSKVIGNVTANGPTFETRQSTTLKVNETKKYYNFFDNVNVHGVQGEDQVSVFGNALDLQKFGLISKVNGEGHLDGVSGVIGAGPLGDGTEFTGAPWESLIHKVAKKVSNGKFTLWLNSNENSAEKGQLTFADRDLEHCEKSTVEPGAPKNYRGNLTQWGFPVSGFGSGRNRFGRAGNVFFQNDDKIIKTLANTYNSLASVWRLSFDRKLNARVVKCADIGKLPPFFLNVDRSTLEFPAEIFFTPTENKEICRFIVDAAQAGPISEVFQLTQDFLKYVCVTFDTNTKSLSFSKAIPKN